MRRHPAPGRTPDVNSDIHKLALDVRKSLHEARLNQWTGKETICNSALYGLGYGGFVIGGSSTPPTTPRRREQLRQNVRQFPWGSRLSTMLDIVGYNPPRVEVSRGVEPLAPYVRVDMGENVTWGLNDSEGRNLAVARFDRAVLEVEDGGEILKTIHGSVLGPNTTTLAEHGLTDDDYRFRLRLVSDQGAWNLYTFDWAIVDSVWTQLDNQGRDWDGEYGDTGD